MPGGLRVVGGGQNIGVQPARPGQRGLQGARQLRAMARKAQAARRMADGLLILGAGDGELGARLSGGGARLGERGARLRNIRSGDLAHLETRQRGLKLLAQDGYVALAQVEDLTVAHDIHVGGGRVKQHLLLHREKILPPGAHGGLGLFDALHGLEAVENGLCQGDGNLFGIVILAKAGSWRRLLVAHGHGAIGENLGPPAGLRPGHALVRGAQAGALGGDLRVVQIGLRQSRRQALRMAGRGKRKRQQGGRRNEQKPGKQARADGRRRRRPGGRIIVHDPFDPFRLTQFSSPAGRAGHFPPALAAIPARAFYRTAGGNPDDNSGFEAIWRQNRHSYINMIYLKARILSPGGVPAWRKTGGSVS